MHIPALLHRGDVSSWDGYSRDEVVRRPSALKSLLRQNLRRFTHPRLAGFRTRQLGRRVSDTFFDAAEGGDLEAKAKTKKSKLSKRRRYELGPPTENARVCVYPAWQFV